MKKRMLTLAVALACLTLPAAAENNTGAQIIRLDGADVLTVNKDGQETRSLPLAGEGANVTVLLATDDMLFLSCIAGARHTTYDFHYTDGAWYLSAVRETVTRTAEWQDPAETVVEEHFACLDGGLLKRSIALSDENDNLLYSAELPPLPDALPKDRLLLENFSLENPPLCGEGYVFDREHDSPVCDAVLAAEFACLNSGYQLLSATEYAEMQFVAQRPDGARVLLCGAYDGQKWAYTESTPLPAGAYLQPWWPMLVLTEDSLGVTVSRNAQGRWGLSSMRLADRDVALGPVCIAEFGGYPSLIALGTHAWGDIATIDWAALPHTVAEACTALYTIGWATPNNPNPNDRLNLREQPDRGSGSLGKYYNGAPVQVLSHGKEWSHVRVGGTEGYMMTRYLAFGPKMQAVKSACPVLLPTHALSPVRRENGQTDTLPLDGKMLVIGVHDNGEYILWDCLLDEYFAVPPDALWAGNG